ncbi:hypothetical protein PRUB_a4072 [Pseudoalteromonas rubra]|uniref:Phage scaffold protein n=1 Tax=Pseudoalteromonas rubra TaxID=43658 RepID=A0A8T0C8U8_9GAMM|nr:phage protease [Pseudoalteromonas rubra]KAF7787194.1 hypothetical protein PRUB_a4072 [Pseudoalteromonas rubra]
MPYPNLDNKNLGLAVCSLVSTPGADGISPRVLIIPDGQFSSQDGRPHDVPGGKWLMDETAFGYLTHSASLRPNDYLFDYDHQTMFKAQNGKPAPASGWFGSDGLEYVPDEGVYALNVRWTPAAYKQLLDKEYRYVSPVFVYDSETGRPIALLHVALTNDPAVLGMDEVAVLNTHLNTLLGAPTMNEAQKLLKALGITVDGDVTGDHIAQGTSKIETLQQQSSKAAEKDTQIAALNTQLQQAQAAKPAAVDLSKFVPVETYNALLTNFAALNTQHQGVSIESTIDKAKADGRVIEAEVDYLKQLGDQQGLAALNTILDARSPIAALTTQQTTQIKLPDGKKTGVAALSTEDKYAADQLGISYKDYAKLKEDDQ